MTDRHERRYKKGDEKAGGGGGRGGGGKRTRPPESWEKGDVARQVRAARPEAQMPRKPGRAATDAEATMAEHAHGVATAEPAGLTRLRRINAKLLTTLRKLGSTARAAERVELLREVEDELALKRGIESRLAPLLDDADVGGIVDELRSLDATIDAHLAKLESSSPDRPEFTLAVHVLHGEIEMQIRMERDGLMPIWATAEPEVAAALGDFETAAPGPG